MDQALLQRQKEVYCPLVEEFCRNAIQARELQMGGLFLPTCMPGYSNAPVKVFYVGQDTLGWIPLQEMLTYFENNDIEGYILENNAWFSPESISKETKNNPGLFWTFVRRLHLRLKGEPSGVDINTLTERQKALIKDWGWGNLNSIEKPTTLRNEGVWDKIDQAAYWKLKNASRGLDAIKHTLDVFGPNLLFILNWDDAKEEDAFSGLKVEWQKDDYVEDLIATYSVEGYQTKIIWTVHPGRLKWIGVAPDDLIEQLIKRVPAGFR